MRVATARANVCQGQDFHEGHEKARHERRGADSETPHYIKYKALVRA